MIADDLINEGCEVILHGGDINCQRILDELAETAPVKAVRGNNDKEWAAQIPETLQLELFGLSVFLIHNKKDLPKEFNGKDLVIYGHFHKYEEREKDGVLYLNPGSCGPRRFHQEITLAILNIGENRSFSVEKVVIPHTKKWKTEEEALPEGIAGMLPAIMKEIEAGKTVKQIAGKYKISEELSEQICRMYLTHPGIDVEGILRRLS
ncbi:MAG: metallophosphatase family protein [Fusicatenibacter sp.]|nr:metallophosphatase family protein [Fusicatenibacter sp.]